MQSEPPACNILDFDLIAERRRELGLSIRTLGRLIGLSAPTLTRLEQAGTQCALRIDTVAKLADALQLEPHQLVCQADHEPPTAGREDIRLEAAILHSRRSRPLIDFQRPLGLTGKQLRDAADQLEHRLAGTGAELRRHGGFTIGPRISVLTRKEKRHLLDRSSRRPALRLDQVRTLQQVRIGEVETVGFDGSLGGGNFPATIGYLRKNGYIRDHNGRYELTDEVSFSLGINKPERAPRRLPPSSKRGTLST